MSLVGADGERPAVVLMIYCLTQCIVVTRLHTHPQLCTHLLARYASAEEVGVGVGGSGAGAGGLFDLIAGSVCDGDLCLGPLLQTDV